MLGAELDFNPVGRRATVSWADARIFIHKVPRALQPASNFAPRDPLASRIAMPRCWSYFFR